MGERIAFGPYPLDATTSTLLRGDNVVSLGGRAAGVLRALLEADGEVVAKPQLMDQAWPDTIVEEGNLAVQVATLRKILGTRPDGAEWIGNVARVGHRLVRDAAGIVASAYAHLGRIEEAQAQLARAHAIWPDLTVSSLLGRTGQPEGRDRVLVEGLRLTGLREL